MHIEHLDFACGTRIRLPPAGVTVFVGPNNAGKSTALGELRSYITQAEFSYNNRVGRVFSGGAVSKPDEEEWVAWISQFLDETAAAPLGSPHGARMLRNWSSTLQAVPSDTYAWLHSMTSNLHHLQGFLISPGPQHAFDGPSPDIYNPTGGPVMGTNQQLSRLFLDPKLEVQLRELAEKVFNTPVSLNRYGGITSLHFGSVPVLVAPATEADIDRVRAVPRVNEQGEGVRALLALAISLELGEEPFVFLDEPDAHLHPPQARRAGEYVARRGLRSQVFVATHSLDFLLGLISPQVSVTVVRLSRDSGTQDVATLDARQLLDAWSDPAVRYSGALGSIMHRGAVLCESDVDSVYYEGALDHLRNGRAHDLKFIAAGGKNAIPKLMRTLVPLGVPVAAVVDFDALRDWALVKTLFEIAGGDSSRAESLWRDVNGQLSGTLDPRTVEDIVQLVASIGAEIGLSTVYSSPMRSRFMAALDPKDGWAIAKSFGIDALKGTAHDSAKALVSALAERGVMVLPFGELEDMHKSAPRNPKSSWLPYVLENGLYRELRGDQIDFIEHIAAFCGVQ